MVAVEAELAADFVNNLGWEVDNSRVGRLATCLEQEYGDGVVHGRGGLRMAVGAYVCVCARARAG